LISIVGTCWACRPQWNTKNIDQHLTYKIRLIKSLNWYMSSQTNKRGNTHRAAHTPCHALFHGEVCDSHSSSLDVHSPTFGDTPSMSALPCSLPCHNHAL
jgi:hypothetical protein